jgi:hypothetical protein
MQNFPSSMGRLLAANGSTQAGSLAVSGSGGLWQRGARPWSASQNTFAGQRTEADSSISPVEGGGGSLNKSQLSDWMDAHALTRSSHRCAMYCRLGMEAAGLNTADRPQSGDAGDYGPFLLRHGAQTVAPDSYVPQVGDVVVFDKTDQHPFGHIEMYDGHQWVSDFMQHSFSPYRDASSTPPFTIYRLA